MPSKKRPLTDEQRHAKRAADRAYYAANKARRLAQSRAYLKAHPEKKSAINKRYRARHLARVRAMEKASRDTHPETNGAWARRNPDARRAVARKYVRTHRDRMLVHTHRRLARKKALPVQWTLEDQQRMFAAWHYACAVCGRENGFVWALSADHWIPLASPDCPGTVPWNMLPLCVGEGGCNHSKGAHDGAAWLVERFGPRKARAILQRIEAYFHSLRPPNSR